MIIRAGDSGGGSGPQNVLQLAKGTYDFAVSGGALGATIPLGAIVPSGCMVVHALVKSITPMGRVVPGDQVQFSIGLETTTDVLALTAYSAIPFNSSGVYGACYCAIGASTRTILTTAERNATMTIDGGSEDGLSAGKFELYLFYFDPASL